MTEPRAPKAPPREERKAWCIDERKVVEATAYSCEGSGAKDYWWVPSLGWSGMEGRSVFFDRDHAVIALRGQLKEELQDIYRALEAAR